MSTWLITGANRGIGLELARRVGMRGDKVIGCTRDPASSGHLAELNVQVEQLDVTDPASVAGLARRLSGTPIDVLVNNAGVTGTRGRLAELDFDLAQKVLAVNTIGPVRVTQALLPNLRAGADKRIVEITSLMGSIGDNRSGGVYAYRMSKAALNMFNSCLAVELGPEGFTCVVLNPGWLRTRLGGQHAPLSVEEGVDGLLKVIDGLTVADNGRFYNHDGRALPW